MWPPVANVNIGGHPRMENMSIYVHTVHSLDACSVPLVGMSVLDCSIYMLGACHILYLHADIQ